MTGTIPSSDALLEASPTSITDYLSKDPFEMTDGDRKAIVQNLREQRKRWEAAEAAGRSPKTPKAAKSLATDKSLGDLGL